MLKIHVAVWHRTYASEFRYLITNHATNAIQSFTWLTRNSESDRRIMSETRTKLDNLSKKYSTCPPWAFAQARAASASRTKEALRK